MRDIVIRVPMTVVGRPTCESLVGSGPPHSGTRDDAIVGVIVGVVVVVVCDRIQTTD